MRIATLKIREVPDGWTCTRPHTTPITHNGYCEWYGFGLSTRPSKRTDTCRLFDKSLSLNKYKEPVKCKECLAAEYGDINKVKLYDLYKEYD